MKRGEVQISFLPFEWALMLAESETGCSSTAFLNEFGKTSERLFTGMKILDEERIVQPVLDNSTRDGLIL